MRNSVDLNCEKFIGTYDIRHLDVYIRSVLALKDVGLDTPQLDRKNRYNRYLFFRYRKFDYFLKIDLGSFELLLYVQQFNI
jgi:hypothetical protein